MSPNLARFTSVESTAGRAGSRSGNGARLDEWVMALTRKLNRRPDPLVTAAGADPVHIDGAGGDRDVRVRPGKAADDLPRRPEHAAGRRARSQHRRTLAALHAERPRLE